MEFTTDCTFVVTLPNGGKIEGGGNTNTALYNCSYIDGCNASIKCNDCGDAK